MVNLKPRPAKLNITSTQTRGVKPEWAALPKRHCDNCGTRYKPKQPLRTGQQYGFCQPSCKKEFHKHGGAYRKLKGEMQKMLARELKALGDAMRQIAREQSDVAFLAAVGEVRQMMECKTCRAIGPTQCHAHMQSELEQQILDPLSKPAAHRANR